MTEERTIWIEKLRDRTGLHYPYLFLLVTAVSFGIFYLFSLNVRYFHFDAYTQLGTTALCLLLGLELSGIPYLIALVKKTLRDIPVEDSAHNPVLASFEQCFYRRRYRYAVILLVVVPFVLIAIFQVLTGCVNFSCEPQCPEISCPIKCPFYYCFEPTVWSRSLDLYSRAAGFLSVCLLALLLWLCIALIITFREMGDVHHRHIRIDRLKIDKIGGLSPLRSLLVRVEAVYFLSLLLALVTYVAPFNFLNYESLIYLVLLAAGFILLLTALSAIRKINRARIQETITGLNEMILLHEEKMMQYISDSDDKTMREPLLFTKNKLDILYEERARLLTLHEETRGYDARTIILFLSVAIPALLEFLNKTVDFWKNIGTLFGFP